MKIDLEMTAGIIRMFGNETAEFGSPWDVVAYCQFRGNTVHIQAMAAVPSKKLEWKDLIALKRYLHNLGYSTLTWDRAKDGMLVPQELTH